MKGYELDDIEREILEKFERGKLRNTPGIEREVELALHGSDSTPEDYTKVRCLLSPSQMKLVLETAEKQGMSHQEWVADTVRRYLRGTLADKTLPKMVNGEIDYQFDEEELEILEAFERGEMPSVPDLERSLEDARQRARNTLRDYTRVFVSLSPNELKIALVRAERRGAPYSTMVSNAVYKRLEGMLIDKEQQQTVAAGARPSRGGKVR